MRRLPLAMAINVAVATLLGPGFASAQTYDRQVETRRATARYSRHHYDNCRRSQRSSANKGTIAGALVGGASGALIGGDALGALVGAGVGAVGGHEIAKRRVRC